MQKNGVSTKCQLLSYHNVTNKNLSQSLSGFTKKSVSTKEAIPKICRPLNQPKIQVWKPMRTKELLTKLEDRRREAE